MVEFETCFCNEVVKIERGKVLKKNNIGGLSWSSVKRCVLKK